MKSWFFKKINKIDKALAKQMEKTSKPQMLQNIRFFCVRDGFEFPSYKMTDSLGTFNLVLLQIQSDAS